MKAGERREKLKKILAQSAEPISGSALAKMLSVSRQVIVTDIAILRAEGSDIISTSQGYLTPEVRECKRIFKVHHSREECETELNLFVDCGAIVKMSSSATGPSASSAESSIYAPVSTFRISWNRSEAANPPCSRPPRKVFTTTLFLPHPKKCWTRSRTASGNWASLQRLSTMSRRSSKKTFRSASLPLKTDMEKNREKTHSQRIFSLFFSSLF